MPESLVSLLAGVLLAAACGLNPYLPLMIFAAMARFGGHLQPLPPFSFLGETWFLVVAAVLFLANVFLDKRFLPSDSLAALLARRGRFGVGVIHDLGQIVLGCLGAALLMGATCRLFPPAWPFVAPMLGILLAALVYAGRRTWRHLWAGRLGPFTNMLMSTLEDVVVVFLSLGAVLLLRK